VQQLLVDLQLLVGVFERRDCGFLESELGLKALDLAAKLQIGRPTWVSRWPR
jgi:hypothetical protein